MWPNPSEQLKNMFACTEKIAIYMKSVNDLLLPLIPSSSTYICCMYLKYHIFFIFLTFNVRNYFDQGLAYLGKIIFMVTGVDPGFWERGSVNFSGEYDKFPNTFNVIVWAYCLSAPTKEGGICLLHLGLNLPLVTVNLYNWNKIYQLSHINWKN